MKLISEEVREKMSFNKRNCIMMRMGEKKILNFFLKFAQYNIGLFSLTANVTTKFYV